MTKASRARQSSTTLVVVVTAYLIFIFLGIPDGMLGVAWPTMRATFGVELGQMGVLLLASTVGFLITSFSVGRLITRLGIVSLLVIATVVRGGALLGGRGRPGESAVGEVTKYVMAKAPCPVILTAPARDAPAPKVPAAPGGDAEPPGR